MSDGEDDEREYVPHIQLVRLGSPEKRRQVPPQPQAKLPHNLVPNLPQPQASLRVRRCHPPRRVPTRGTNQPTHRPTDRPTNHGGYRLCTWGTVQHYVPSRRSQKTKTGTPSGTPQGPSKVGVKVGRLVGGVPSTPPEGSKKIPPTTTTPLDHPPLNHTLPWIIWRMVNHFNHIPLLILGSPGILYQVVGQMAVVVVFKWVGPVVVV